MRQVIRSSAIAVLTMTMSMMSTGALQAQKYDACLKAIGRFQFDHASRAWPEDGVPKDVALVIIPHADSYKNNTLADLKDSTTRKWLGAIMNYGSAPDPYLKLGRGEMACFWIAGDGASATVTVSFADPAKDHEIGFLGCGDVTDPVAAHADWKHPGDCSKMLEFSPKGITLLKGGQPKALPEDRQAVWISCASDGCCRIQI